MTTYTNPENALSGPDARWIPDRGFCWTGIHGQRLSRHRLCNEHAGCHQDSAPELLVAEGALHRIRERVRAVSAIRHANVAAVHALEVVDGIAVVVMEFVERRTIARKSNGPLSIGVAWHLASALRAIHRAGVAHGDVRASNVMVDSAGRVKLVDFSHTGGELAADWAQYRSLVAWLLISPAAGSPRDLPNRHRRFAVVRDKVVLNLGRMTGNLYVTR